MTSSFETISNKLETPNLFEIFDELFEKFSECKQQSFELWNSVKHWKKKFFEPPWFHIHYEVEKLSVRKDKR